MESHGAFKFIAAFLNGSAHPIILGYRPNTATSWNDNPCWITGGTRKLRQRISLCAPFQPKLRQLIQTNRDNTPFLFTYHILLSLIITSDADSSSTPGDSPPHQVLQHNSNPSQNGPDSKLPSPLQLIVFRSRSVWIKRDDLYFLSSVSSKLYPISGNKARKLESLFHSRTNNSCNGYVSWGGSQSNAMLALAHLAAIQKRRFIYHTPELPPYLRQNLSGNLKKALDSGMELVEHKFHDYMNLFSRRNISNKNDLPSTPKSFLFIPQGIQSSWALQGVSRLVDEVAQQCLENDIHKCTVLICGGTGSTALFFARRAYQICRGGSVIQVKTSEKTKPIQMKVMVVPVASSPQDFFEDMESLDNLTGSYGIFPEILEPSAVKKFGLPDQGLFSMWTEWKDQYNLVLDLIYAPRTWEVFLESGVWDNLADDEHLIYYHCGGVEGNSSQLARYKRFIFK